MTDEKHCGDHSGNCSRIERAENDIQCIWKAIDQMRTWVILGMAALVLQFGAKLFDMVAK
jgi:hypothetical protein